MERELAEHGGGCQDHAGGPGGDVREHGQERKIRIYFVLNENHGQDGRHGPIDDHFQKGPAPQFRGKRVIQDETIYDLKIQYFAYLMFYYRSESQYLEAARCFKAMYDTMAKAPNLYLSTLLSQITSSSTAQGI